MSHFKWKLPIIPRREYTQLKPNFTAIIKYHCFPQIHTFALKPAFTRITSEVWSVSDQITAITTTLNKSCKCSFICAITKTKRKRSQLPLKSLISYKLHLWNHRMTCLAVNYSWFMAAYYAPKIPLSPNCTNSKCWKPLKANTKHNSMLFPPHMLSHYFRFIGTLN